jgi:hypothetical protein
MSLAEATAKIKAEIDKNPNDAYVRIVGEFLLKHLEANPGSAEQILTPDKTVKGSLSEMEKVARTKKCGNCAVLTDLEGFAIVLKYFGIDPVGLVVSPEAPSVVPAPKPAAAFDVRLEDFL